VRPQRLAAIVCVAVVGAAALAVLAMGRGIGWSFERDLWWVRASGWGALLALLGSLCATPIGRVAPYLGVPAIAAYVPAFRRALGLTSAALATVHAAVALATYLRDALDLVLELAWTRAGVVGWTILVALAITSFPRVVKLARVRAWKALHRLAYVAALVVLQHVLLAPLAPRGWVLTAFGGTLALGLLRVVPARRAREVEPSRGEVEPGNTESA
jgi:sulfoxide reductase heme-binding subunit YedZ